MSDGRIQDFATEFGESLKDSFWELAGEIDFFMIIRDSKEECSWLPDTASREWTGYCGQDADRGWMDSLLVWLNSQRLDSDEEVNDNLEEMVSKDEIVYFSYESAKADSRINGKYFKSKKDIIWLIRRRMGDRPQKNNYWKILLAEVIGKTQRQLRDLIFLDYWRQIDSIKDNLFEAVWDKEKIRGRYIKKICEEAGICDQELILRISAKKYEKRELYSRIYLGEVPESGMELSFEDEKRNMWRFSGNNERFIRKVLETAKGERVLVVSKDGGEQLMKGIALLGKEKGNQITFNGYLKWTLTEGGKILLRYEDGNYYLSDREQEEEEYLKAIEGLHLVNGGEIKDVIKSLRAQQHGTSVVFLKNDVLVEELKRLGENNRACRIKPVSILHPPKVNYRQRNHRKENEQTFKEFMIGISAIDGALIADFQGKIHAIGAILDGEAVVEADMSRGARYNSLKNYINWLIKYKKYEPNQCFAVIMSEDGGIKVEIGSP